MAKTILRDEVRLDRLHAELMKLAAAIDNEENVPSRYESNLAGLLADVDEHRLLAAAESVHRLLLWARFPNSDRERYTRIIEAPTGPRSVA